MEDVTVSGPECLIDVSESCTMYELNRLDVVACDYTSKAYTTWHVLELVKYLVDILSRH